MGNYADGRTASQAGGPIRYDAGGKAHVTPSAPEEVSRTRKVGADTEKARRAEYDLLKSQLVDLGNQITAMRSAFYRILDITADDDRFPMMADEISSICQEALK